LINRLDKNTRSEDEWVDGLRHGDGMIYWSNGTRAKVKWN